MKILKIRVSGLKNFKVNDLELNLMPTKRVSKADEEIKSYTKAVRIPNVFGYYGINSSGKTTVLTIIDFMYNFYIGSSSLDGTILEKKLNNLFYNNATFEVLIFDEAKKKVLYAKTELLNYKIDKEQLMELDNKKVETKLKIEQFWLEKTDKDRKLYCDNEITKTMFLEGADSDPKIGLFKTVLETKSIFSILKMSDKSESTCVNTLNKTNFNFLIRKYDNIDHSMINKIAKFLDSNLEHLRFDDDNSDEIFIKFVNRNEVLVKQEHIDDFLSSGTIRGLDIFQKAIIALKCGGVFIVDEIDIHLNHSIVEQIIQLFNNRYINQRGAQLIFSSHAPALLDSVYRDDLINILVKNQEKLEIKNLSEYTLRNDKVKSNSFAAGEVDSNPQYKEWFNLFEEIECTME